MLLVFIVAKRIRRYIAHSPEESGPYVLLALPHGSYVRFKRSYCFKYSFITGAPFSDSSYQRVALRVRRSTFSESAEYTIIGQNCSAHKAS